MDNLKFVETLSVAKFKARKNTKILENFFPHLRKNMISD